MSLTIKRLGVVLITYLAFLFSNENLSMYSWNFVQMAVPVMNLEPIDYQGGLHKSSYSVNELEQIEEELEIVLKEY